ncbi:DUF1707 domain-containing protein [Pseudonocardia sp. N23]|uniref:DUF1707 SHOCT-like domain-containing protein n=1 Tax=Pseudonocardia sp. N23 TaxID=1987376 RepID=UPI000BFBD675|nr:DUF1707 domain-containing protein [Pseudonocardia sp. N23]GAY10942.1 hypothetical protein TOK_5427 [Pseudonocardia sp. N23]
MSSQTNRPEPAGRDRSTTSAGPVRASDAERADVVATLHEALGHGRLDLAETDERVADAYSARFRHELAVLVHDLPAAEVDRGRLGGDRTRSALRAIKERAARRPLVAAAALVIGIGAVGGVVGASAIDDGPSGPPGVAHVHDHTGAPLPR